MKDKVTKKMTCLLIVILGLGMASCSTPAQKYTSTDVGMGTMINQTVYVQGDGEEVTRQIQELVDELEGQISWRIETSEVSKINASAGADRNENAADGSGQNNGSAQLVGYRLPDDLAAEFQTIWQVSEDSEGAFDLTVAPVVRLWDIDTWAGMTEEEMAEQLSGISADENGVQSDKGEERVLSDFLPGDAEIKDKLSLTGYENIGLIVEGKIVSNQKLCEQIVADSLKDDISMIYLPEGYMLDLGAVGKGMACDRILKLLEGDVYTQETHVGEDCDCAPPVTCDFSKVQGAVISLGGNILTYGEKPDGSPWKVGIVDPENPDTYLGMITLRGINFVTTSGDYERYVEIDGVRYHHIINPETGYPADSGIRSVTILSDSGLIGDALSTACFVLGKEKAMELAKGYGVEILLVTDEGELVMSEGMKNIFSEKK